MSNKFKIKRGGSRPLTEKMLVKHSNKSVIQKNEIRRKMNNYRNKIDSNIPINNTIETLKLKDIHNDSNNKKENLDFKNITNSITDVSNVVFAIPEFKKQMGIISGVIIGTFLISILFLVISPVLFSSLVGLTSFVNTLCTIFMILSMIFIVYAIWYQILEPIYNVSKQVVVYTKDGIEFIVNTAANIIPRAGEFVIDKVEEYIIDPVIEGTLIVGDGIIKAGETIEPIFGILGDGMEFIGDTVESIADPIETTFNVIGDGIGKVVNVVAVPINEIVKVAKPVLAAGETAVNTLKVFQNLPDLGNMQPIKFARDMASLFSWM